MNSFKTLSLVALQLIGYWSHSQEGYVTILGRILDVETEEPLSFATVNVLNSAKGVVANENGEFEFKIATMHLSDTIVFSMAGYQTEKILTQSLSLSAYNDIHLVSQEVVLSEVVVTNKKLTAWDIIALAKNNIKNNYPTRPFEFKAFYRDYKIENDQCISIFEAAIAVFDKGYFKSANLRSLREKVVLEQVRKSLKVPYKTHVFNDVNVIKELLMENDVRYHSRALDKKRGFEYQLDGYEIIDDRLMYKIKAKKEWEYSIYVDVVTYAIPRVAMNFEWLAGIDENKWTTDSIVYNQTSATVLMDFQMIDDLYYPRYCSFTAGMDAFHSASEDLLFTSYLEQEYMVTDINIKPKESPKKEKWMNPHIKIEEQPFTYDSSFWKNYNIIKTNPRKEELILGLEERMNLSKQFSSPNQ